MILMIQYHYYDKNSNIPKKYTHGILPLNEIFVFFDQRHITGTDIKN